jgi:hypothetical protein
MPITTRCTACKKTFSAPDGSSGRVTECPNCGESTAIGRVIAAPIVAPAKQETSAQYIAKTVDTVYVLGVFLSAMAWLAPGTLAALELTPGGMVFGVVFTVLTLPIFALSLFLLKLWASSILIFCEMASDLRTIARNSAR